MMKNLELTKGLVFSQAVLLKLVEKGMARGQAHELLQRLALQAQEGEKDFKELLLENGEVGEHLAPEEIEKLFDYEYHLRYIDRIFSRFPGSA
jgi:adenylosuccinate lyase